MDMNSYFYYDSELGRVGVAENGFALTHVQFEEEEPPLRGEERETPLLKEAAAQLKEYFAGLRKEFDLPLSPKGTDFQQKVWAALQRIPYGETRSYRQVAEAVGNPRGCRAVGMANNRNPISILIPCHRVIGKDGGLVGYGGGLDRKKWLLALEKEQREELPDLGKRQGEKPSDAEKGPKR